MKTLYIVFFGVLVWRVESIQPNDVLTLKQRIEIFGTNRSDELPSIKFVNIQSVGLDNARPFRKRPANVLQYRLTMDGEEIVLTLRHNKDLITPGCVVHHHQLNGYKVIYPCAKRSAHCFYKGRSDTHKDYWAAVNTCNGLRGVIGIRNKTLAIAPLNRKQISHYNNDNETHVVYRYSGEKSVCKTKDTLTALKSETTNRSRSRRGVGESNYIEASVVIDPSVNDFYGYRSEEFVQTTFNVASKLYEDQTIGENIKLCLSELHIYESYNNISVQFTMDAQQILNDFCSWHSKVTPTNPDCTILYTRLDIEYQNDVTAVGLANPSAMCQKGRNCAIVQDVGPASGITMAHEIGHLLGMKHDQDINACKNSLGIMTSGATGGAAFRWSPCSARVLKAFLGTPGAECLSNQPSGMVFSLGYNGKAPLPGTVLTRLTQCQLLLGNQASQCDVRMLKPEAICVNLYCRKSPTANCTLESQVLDGTDCNNTRTMCMSSKCIAMDKDTSVPPIDGVWSDWDSSYSSCTRTCGGGVKIKRRTCTNPPPQFGGKQCVGPNLKAVMCNMQTCKGDYKEEQCTQVDQVYKNYGHWIPILGTTGDDSCIRSCETSDGRYQTPDHKPYADGTECEYGRGIPFARCIDGKCRKFGCDGVMDSGMPYDKCGVCNGTGAGCRRVFGNYKKNDDSRKFTSVQVIPRGSYGIHIQQKSPYSFITILINGHKVFNANPSHPSHTGMYIDSGVKIHYSRHVGIPETVDIDGPTAADVEIQVYRWYYLPPDINYEFYRRNAEQTTKYRWLKYLVKCSKSCGTGYHEPVVRCIDLSSRPVDNYLCDIATKPSEIRTPCNQHFCPPVWQTSDLGPCTKSCGPGGIRQRKVHCVRKNNGSDLQLISGCDQNTRPHSVINCTLVSCPGYWRTGPWSQCSKTCSEGVQTRVVRCLQGDDNPTEERFCSRDTRPANKQSCFTQFCPGAPAGSSCSNLKPNCKQNYGVDICVGNYSIWAEQHCMKECRVCTTGDDPRCKALADTGDNPCVKYQQWATTNCRDLCSGCVDQPQCQQLIDRGTDVCKYTAFSKKNCPSMCGYCGTCEDKSEQPCSTYDLKYCNLDYMRKMCRKYCGICSA